MILGAVFVLLYYILHRPDLFWMIIRSYSICLSIVIAIVLSEQNYKLFRNNQDIKPKNIMIQHHFCPIGAIANNE